MGGLQNRAICFIFADMDMTIMLAVGFFGSAEFYILLAVVAAAIVAAAARPAFTGPVREELLAAELLPAMPGEKNEPSIECRCSDGGRVIFIRHGLDGMTDSGAVSLAVKIKGNDISIEERLSAGSMYDDPVADAMFTLDNLAPAFYHISYHSDKLSRFVAFTLHNRPGITTVKSLNQ